MRGPSKAARSHRSQGVVASGDLGASRLARLNRTGNHRQAPDRGQRARACRAASLTQDTTRSSRSYESGVALDLESWSDQFAMFGTDPVLHEAIIPAFVFQVRRAFCCGLRQGCRTADEAMTTVEGRTRFDEQIRRRFGVSPPVEVRYDDYTEDVELNRLIKAAIHRRGRLRVRSDPARSALASRRFTMWSVSASGWGRSVWTCRAAPLRSSPKR